MIDDKIKLENIDHNGLDIGDSNTDGDESLVLRNQLHLEQQKIIELRKEQEDSLLQFKEKLPDSFCNMFSLK